MKTAAVIMILLVGSASATDWTQLDAEIASASVSSDWTQLDALPSRIFPESLHLDAVEPVDGLASPAPRTRGLMVTASWCGPCQVFKTKEIPRLKKSGWRVGDKDTDHLKLVDESEAGPYNVSALPTYIRLVDGKEVARHVGAMDALQLAEFVYPSNPKTTVAADGAPTPMAEVERVLALLPKPQVAFVDFGCGDGRWAIAAAEKWNMPAIGIEIDPGRAAAARERVAAAGLGHLVTIVNADATTVDVQADVGVAYLYAPVIEKLRPRILQLRAFASYMHRPSGIPVVRNGDSWIYRADQQQVAQFQPVAIWQGQAYTGPVCADPRCDMCNSIRQSLNQQQPSRQVLYSEPKRKTFLGLTWE